MPRMDGMDFCSVVRHNRTFRLIFLTSKEEEVDEVLALKVGADDFYPQPFSQRLLLERVKVLLRPRNSKG